MNFFIPAATRTKLKKKYATNPTAALIAAGKVILQRAGWCRGTEAKTKYHKTLSSAGFRSEVENPAAGAFCAIGAVRRAQFELTGSTDAEVKFNNAVDRLNGIVPDRSIVDFNDDSKATRAKVIKVFEKALKS
jgi:hypothetical protein